MNPCAKEDPQDSWEIYVNRNTARIDQKKKKITKWKEVIGPPEILLTGMGQEPRERTDSSVGRAESHRDFFPGFET